jgi:hypothetical protein
MFKRTRSTKDFADEIKAHLDLEAEELRHEGLSEAEAHRKAKSRKLQSVVRSGLRRSGLSGSL